MDPVESKIKRRLMKALGFDDEIEPGATELMLHAATRIERLKWELGRATEQQVPGKV